MTILADVQARVSTTLLLQITRQGNTPATTVDLVRLQLAVDDATAEFLTETGLVLDDTNAAHRAAGVVGTVYYLHAWVFTETPAVGRQRERWERLLAKIATTQGAERRILPTTGSVLLPSTEQNDAVPDHDRTRWRDFVPDMPAGGTEQDARFFTD